MGTLVTLGACSERKLWAHDKAPWVQFVGVAVTHESVYTHTYLSLGVTHRPRAPWALQTLTRLTHECVSPRSCHSALHIAPVPLGTAAALALAAASVAEPAAALALASALALALATDPAVALATPTVPFASAAATLALAALALAEAVPCAC